MCLGWKIIGILYIIALIPSLIMTVMFIKNNTVPNLGKTLTFLSIWLIMPFYMVSKLINKINKLL